MSNILNTLTIPKDAKCGKCQGTAFHFDQHIMCSKCRNFGSFCQDCNHLEGHHVWDGKRDTCAKCWDKKNPEKV